ncbi:MAG: enoyl-CoA hydratase/isomerase family protein, partial [Rhodococcus sp. (in: high G+C Gram-positive bacteria)]|nr:enoyl-CoA hydratase/isomerase family protein [Rhodococcus sp. (in: high G+C Gram-positive bacteria)]
MSDESPIGRPALQFTIDDGIAVVTLDRPAKLNSLDPELVCRLADAWDAIAADPGVRVAIVTGAGERAFCTGADLGRLIPLFTRARPADDEWDERLLADRTLLDRALLRRTDFTVPVIAAVRGFALAGGTELMLGADLRVVADDSEFGLTEVTRGIIPAGGGLSRLARHVSWARAAEIVLVGNRIDARTALEIGLVNRVVESDEVMAVAMELAQRMARNGPLAMRAAKEVMVTSNGMPLDEAFAVESRVAGRVMKSSDAVEGPRAFIEKR